MARPNKRFKKTQIHVCNNEKIHQRSKHYGIFVDFAELASKYPYLEPYVYKNKFGGHLINFKDKLAQYHLSMAYLDYFYNLRWELPLNSFVNYLIPPIPGRANYIHFIGDLTLLNSDFEFNLPTKEVTLKEINNSKRQRTENDQVIDPHNTECTQKQNSEPSYTNQIPLKGSSIKILDIGVGGNCIYPLIGVAEYDWDFIGTDIDPGALQVAQKNISLNSLETKITLKLQPNKNCYFENIIDKESDFYFSSICNPPFNDSIDQINVCPVREYSGNINELTVEGGDIAFISSMIAESKKYFSNVMWFTCLVPRLITLKRLWSQISGEIHISNKLKNSDKDYHDPLYQKEILDSLCSYLEQSHEKDTATHIIYSKISTDKDFHTLDREIKPPQRTIDNSEACTMIKAQRIFTLYQGKQTRWVICWTFFDDAQRSRIIKVLKK